MSASCTLQLHLDGAWHDAGSVSLFGAMRDGWRAATYTGYDVGWAVQHAGATDARAFSCRFPVGLEALERPHWPVFLIDLLPQGFGREELLRLLGHPANAAEPADWALLQAGGGHTIGNLRIKEAAKWLAARQGPQQGFGDDEVAARGDAFSEHLATHGLFVAGSSGVQGEWPKLLLTRADDGLLHLDHTLPDERAREHYIVKFGRGPDARLAQILRHEAPYMALARQLGLRIQAELRWRERVLFIPRFDRRRLPNGRIERLGQESIASLTGRAGFGVAPSHDEVCRLLRRHCTDPQTELLEYLRRDVANLALGNKDNHARNTALQRTADGTIRLTPLFDFAPMLLHPDGIARRMRWEDNDYRLPDWSRVLDAVCAPLPAADCADRHAAPPPPAPDRAALAAGLRAMAPVLHAIAADGAGHGLEPDLHRLLRPGLEQLADHLDRLH